MSWRDIIQGDKGLGDNIARTTDYVGIKKCGGCAKRQEKLNKLVKYNFNEYDHRKMCDYDPCDKRAEWEAKEWPRAYCQKHYEMLIDTKVFV
ncbi:uncharacterized protein METZ01_LOCUS322854, partial [marine metagenome]